MLSLRMLLCFGLGMRSLLQAEAVMNQDPLERMRHRLWRLEARIGGFAEREAWYLAFWRWLASQRGETRNRMILGPVLQEDERVGLS